MAKTRKKIAPIQFDDLDPHQWVAMKWRTPGPDGSVIVHTATGMFIDFERLPTGEYLVVIQVVECRDVSGPGAWRRRFELVNLGPLKFSTRGKPEFWHWNGKYLGDKR